MPGLISSLLLGASSLTHAAFPAQSYKTETLTPPDLAITKNGATEPGYLFFAPTGSGTKSKAPLIMTDTNELIWHGPYVTAFNFGVQQYQGKDVLVYWTGVASNVGGGNGKVVILDNTYTQYVLALGRDAA